MNILIIEDEPKAVKRIERLIMELEDGATILAALDSVEGALKWLVAENVKKVDLAFVDIELADGTSFEIFEQRRVDFPVVFTTAYNAYVLDAFRVNAVDYLLKPLKQEELARALEKHHRLHKRVGVDPELIRGLLREIGHSSYRNRYVTRVGRKIKVIPTDEIAYFFSEDKVTFLMHQGGKRYPLDQALTEVEAGLDPEVFFRANRQYLVRIESIKLIHTLSKSRLKLELQPVSPGDVIVSSERSAGFKKWIEG